jgi:hypothetical protein
MVITHGKYNAIRRTLYKKSNKYEHVVLPYMSPSRTLCLNPEKEMKFLLQEYALQFFTEEDQERIKSWEEDMDELACEIDDLQEDLGDIERKIKNYPLDTLKIKVV